jgi:hypothetical protein
VALQELHSNINVFLVAEGIVLTPEDVSLHTWGLEVLPMAAQKGLRVLRWHQSVISRVHVHSWCVDCLYSYANMVP